MPRFFVLLTALITVACGTTPAPEVELQPLTAAELRQTLLGHTLSRRGGTWWRAWEYAGLHREDGTMTGRVWWSGGEEIAAGVWMVTDEGLYCRTWGNHWGGGQRACFRGSRGGGTLVFDYVSGAPGNPQGL